MLLGIQSEKVKADSVAPAFDKFSKTIEDVVAGRPASFSWRELVQPEKGLVNERRGFIDVPQPTALTIRSHSPEGYALDLMTMLPIVSSMRVRGFDSELSLGAEGGTIIQRWQGARVVNLSLTFTLVLAPGLTAGRYPWPMRVAVRPLEQT